MSDVTFTLVSDAIADSNEVDDISADGRFVTYGDGASLHIKDLQTADDRLVASAASGHEIAFGDVSDDGRFVAFKDTDASHDSIYIWDRDSGSVQEVDHSNDTFVFVAFLTLSPDGHTLTFTSDADDLIPNDTNNSRDLFQANLVTGDIGRLFQNQFDTNPVSADGRYVIMSAGTTVDGDQLRVDLLTGDTAFVGRNFFGGPSISADGRFIVFSTVDALVQEDTNNKADVYLKDMSTGEVQLVSTSTGGAIGNDESSGAQISADGSRVAFITEATNLAANATQTGGKAFVKDLASGILTFLAPTDGFSGDLGGISSDGLSISLLTQAQLTPSDADSADDAYVVQFHRPVVTFGPIAGDDRINAAEEAAPITVSGTSSAAGINVTVTSPNGATANTVTAANGRWSVTISATGVADGTHAFTVKAVDDSGVTGTASHDVLFDTIPPALTVSLNGGDSINTSQLHASVVSGQSDAIGATVTFKVDGTIVGTATVQPSAAGGLGDYSGTFDASSFADGQHELDVSVADPAGNVNDQSNFFDVDTIPPKITIQSIGGDNVVDASEVDGLVPVIGTVDASDAIGQTVTITIGGEERGTAVVQADRSWHSDVDFSETKGETVVVADVSDRAGNEGSGSGTAYVDSNLIRVSVRADGSQGDDDPHFSQGYLDPSVSADGRFVVFDSLQQGIAPGGSTGSDLLIKDVLTGAVSLLKDDAGQIVSGFNEQMSADGRFVAYAVGRDVFSLELSTGTVTQVNKNADGVVDNGGDVGSSSPDISADGHYVVFTSSGTNLVPGINTQDPNHPTDRVYVKDMQSGEVKIVSFPELDTNLNSIPHSGVGGGRYVAFESTAAGGANDTNNVSDIFVRDLQTGEITLVSATPAGVAGNGESSEPDISPDGRYVAFMSFATDLVPGFTPQPFRHYDYLRDLQTGTTQLLSIAPDGSPVDGLAFDPPNFSFSADDRYVTFLNSPLTLGQRDVYLRDLQAGTSKLISTGSRVDTIDASSADITPDGHYVAFSALADDTVPGDTNLLNDVFLRRLIPQTLTIDPIAGDDHVTATEASAALAIGGISSVIGGEVSVSADGQQVTNATVAADGTWSTTIDTLSLASGTHSVVATVLDGAGFPTSDGAIVTIDDGAPPDVHTFTGGRAEYDVRTSLGADNLLHTVITDEGAAGDATQTLTPPVKIEFAEHHIFALHGAQQNHTANFEGDRFDDVMLQVNGTGQLVSADMEAGVFTGFGVLTSPLPGVNAVGHADMNGDGIADVIVQVASTDQVLIAEQAGSGSGSPAWVSATSALKGGSADFKVVGVGDITGDGGPDIILQNEGASGDGSILAVTSGGSGTLNIVSVAGQLRVDGVVDFRVVGIGDINGDGFADVVLQNQLNGGQVLVDDFHDDLNFTLANVTGPFQVVGVGDVNGDGHADVILQQASGGDVIYLDPTGGANDFKLVVSGIGSFLAKGVADVNNDGFAEVLLENPATGEVDYRHVGASDADGFFGAVINPNGGALHLV